MQIRGHRRVGHAHADGDEPTGVAVEAVGVYLCAEPCSPATATP
jgi:hypothetical protein